MQLIYYSPTLFKTLGIAYDMRLTLSGVMNIIQMVAVVIAMFTFDRIGRRPWLFIGSAGMTLSHFVVAAMIGAYLF